MEPAHQPPPPRVHRERAGGVARGAVVHADGRPPRVAPPRHATARRARRIRGGERFGKSPRRESPRSAEPAIVSPVRVRDRRERRAAVLPRIGPVRRAPGVRPAPTPGRAPGRDAQRRRRRRRPRRERVVLRGGDDGDAPPRALPYLHQTHAAAVRVRAPDARPGRPRVLAARVPVRKRARSRRPESDGAVVTPGHQPDAARADHFASRRRRRPRRRRRRAASVCVGQALVDAFPSRRRRARRRCARPRARARGRVPDRTRARPEAAAEPAAAAAVSRWRAPRRPRRRVSGEIRAGIVQGGHGGHGAGVRARGCERTSPRAASPRRAPRPRRRR